MTKRMSVLRSAGALALLLAVAMVAGCVRQETQGPEDEAARLAQIRKKHETCADVLGMSVHSVDCRAAIADAALMPAAPVCGVDGITYSGYCQAAANKVDVAYDGPCVPQPDTCGVGEDDLGDSTVCTLIFAPACGVDGKTYPSPCAAGQAKVKVAHLGACGDTVRPIEPPDPVDPDTGWVCPAVWQPVCASNGITYGNSCEAIARKLTVVHEGRCDTVIVPIPPKDSGCFPRPLPDTLGPENPRVCIALWDPVCGKDGKTYGNSCEAGNTPIAHKGACGEKICLLPEGCAQVGQPSALR